MNAAGGTGWNRGGTVNPLTTVGGPTPPQTTHKAWAAVLYAAVPALLAGLVSVLSQAGVLFPGAPPWVLQGCAAVLLLLAPIAGGYGAYRTPNRVLVDTQGTVPPPPGAAK